MDQVATNGKFKLDTVRQPRILHDDDRVLTWLPASVGILVMNLNESFPHAEKKNHMPCLFASLGSCHSL